MKAIGMIETKGLVAAIECSDVMVKSSNVKILNKIHIGSGIVTVIVSGDVGSVKAAVDSATLSLKSSNFIFSTHVIPNLSKEIDRLFDLEPKIKTLESIVLPKEDEVILEPEIIETTIGTEDLLVEGTKVEPLKKIDLSKINKSLIDNLVLTEEKQKIEEMLRKLKINDLRKLIREYKMLKITNKEISKLSRQKLIETILSNY